MGAGRILISRAALLITVIAPSLVSRYHTRIWRHLNNLLLGSTRDTWHNYRIMEKGGGRD